MVEWSLWHPYNNLLLQILVGWLCRIFIPTQNAIYHKAMFFGASQVNFLVQLAKVCYTLHVSSVSTSQTPQIYILRGTHFYSGASVGWKTRWAWLGSARHTKAGVSVSTWKFGEITDLRSHSPSWENVTASSTEASVSCLSTRSPVYSFSWTPSLVSRDSKCPSLIGRDSKCPWLPSVTSWEQSHSSSTPKSSGDHTGCPLWCSPIWLPGSCVVWHWRVKEWAFLFAPTRARDEWGQDVFGGNILEIISLIRHYLWELGPNPLAVHQMVY